jgi:hypothetical protein
MNNTLGPAGPAPIDSGLSPIEITIGLLALILALAAVVVGVAQYLQARAAKHRKSDPESGAELSVITSRQSNNGYVGSVSR